MGMPSCECVPPDDDSDMDNPWPRVCAYHARLKSVLLRVAVLDWEGAIDLPDELSAEVIAAAGGQEAVSKVAAQDC